MSKANLTRDQVREVDRRAIEEFGMNGLVLMENAGRGCVDVLCELGVTGPVAILCGVGNNAGDGFVIARHLDLQNIPVRILLLADPQRLSGDAAANFGIVRKTDIPVHQLGESDDREMSELVFDAEWIIDALLGTGAKGDPRPPMDRAIECANATDARRLAVDLPSGLDCDTGEPGTPTFRADHTCTFVAQKVGFENRQAAPYLGKVHVVSIGVPRQLLV